MPDVLRAFEILTRLVAFPTVSRDSNLALIDWLEFYLTGHGLKTARHWNEDQSKAALMAHAGPWVEGGVVLSGHSDVVPVDGQVWTSDPYTLTRRDGRLYGRGSTDMKGFVALSVWALVEVQRRGVVRPLQLALSYDEELGCTGAEPLLSTLVTAFPKASVAIIGEPSMLKPIDGHKGGTGYKVHVKGYEVHSSLLPTGVSSIMEAARLIGWINDQNAAQQLVKPSALAARFFPPFTTLHVGMISGGTAHNITAGDCHFVMEMRVVPGESVDKWASGFEAAAEALDRSISAHRPEASVTLDRFFNVPPLVPEVGGAAETLVRRLTNAGPGGAVSYGTEAGFFQAHGYSAVVCGPGDIAQAHQADEYLEESQFQAGLDFMSRLLEDLS